MSDRSQSIDPSDAGFAAFVAAGWNRYLWTASVLSGDRYHGEELLQECLVKLYSRWRQVARRGDPHAYLRRMLINGNASRWRRWRREWPVAEAPELPDARAAVKEPEDALRQAVRGLPRQQRAVIILRYFEDLTEKDTAATLGCSVGAVKSTHARALAKLREATGNLTLLG